MNTPLVSFEQREKYLLITGHGVRHNVQTMMEASKATYEKVTSTKARFLLVDYRDVTITLPLAEAFNLIRQYEQSMAFLKNTVAAVVFSENGLEFGRYWHEIGTKRGFAIELFDSLEQAEQWLLQQA